MWSGLYFILLLYILSTFVTLGQAVADPFSSHAINVVRREIRFTEPISERKISLRVGGSSPTPQPQCECSCIPTAEFDAAACSKEDGCSTFGCTMEDEKTEGKSCCFSSGTIKIDGDEFLNDLESSVRTTSNEIESASPSPKPENCLVLRRCFILGIYIVPRYICYTISICAKPGQQISIPLIFWRV